MATRGFCTIPSQASKTWSLRGVTLSSTPATNKVTDTTYESPIRSITLTTDFISEANMETLPYLLDDEAFLPEWDFAQEAWEDLMACVTEGVTNYNKKVIARAKELTLSSANVIGRASTHIEHGRPVEIPIHQTKPEPHRHFRTPNNRVETVYEPTIRSTTSTRRSSKVKLSPLQAWLTGQR